MARKKKQAALPGMERETNAELDAAAELYVEARDKRIALSEEESIAKEALIAGMKKAGVETYKDIDHESPLIVTVTPGKDSVKVTAVEEGGDDGDDHPAREAEIDITPPKALGPKRRRSAPVNGTPLG